MSIPDDKNLALQLINYEKHIDSLEDFPYDRRAQSYVCLANQLDLRGDLFVSCA
jgi:hypothetical protein